MDIGDIEIVLGMAIDIVPGGHIIGTGLSHYRHILSSQLVSCVANEG